MSNRPLVLVDADVLGRRRTGDETYVTQLLRELPAVAEDLRVMAVTREPELVPAGIELATAERDSLIARGLERARAFRWDAVAAATVEVYREAAN